MTPFEDDFQKLSRLQTFDPAVFEGDDETPQSVCDFVLALCLVHNDCKDALYAYELLQKEEPHVFWTPRQVSGTYTAMETYVIRIQLALIHELLELIKRHTYDLETPTFKAVRRQMPRRAGDTWDALVAVALGKPTRSRLGKYLAGFRSKVSFRYDERGIRRGYRERYFSDPPSEPRVSLGGSVQATRFYFADASMEDYLGGQVGSEDWVDELKRIADATTRITRALGPILRNFVHRRGYRMRAVTEG
ncbi:MAG: hypothetical protein QGI83_11455 [Candidatus Latescibacteria bacterium]|nr:hypothetical protein [Candidatus Latescibacterota bacterium]